MKRRKLLAALLCAALAAPALARDAVRLSTTTSTENSGLLGAILPAFEKKTGIRVKVIAVGTGKALELARNGDVDVTLVHARGLEDKFVAEGWGTLVGYDYAQGRAAPIPDQVAERLRAEGAETE